MPTDSPSARPSVECADGKSLHRLWMCDAGGDGWGSCLYSITHATSTFDDLEVVLSGSLDAGYIFGERICTDDGCYELQVTEDCSHSGEIPRAPTDGPTAQPTPVPSQLRSSAVVGAGVRAPTPAAGGGSPVDLAVPPGPGGRRTAPFQPGAPSAARSRRTAATGATAAR